MDPNGENFGIFFKFLRHHPPLGASDAPLPSSGPMFTEKNPPGQDLLSQGPDLFLKQALSQMRGPVH